MTPGARAAAARKQEEHGAPPGGSPDPHFRGALPPPDSAFAGAGLNIRRARACRAHASHPLQSLNVRHVTGASLRITHC